MNPARISILITGICLALLPACSEGKPKSLVTNPDPPGESPHEFKVIHAYVALCDNESQGIAPVPAKIGDGDDPANNLYWGCSDGARAYFTRSKRWRRVSLGKVKNRAEILERLVFEHAATGSLLVVDAWRGSEIKPCLEQFVRSMAGQHYESFVYQNGEEKHTVNLGGGADFLCFIGHNGLMEFSLPVFPANPKRKEAGDVALLCCQSERFFEKHLGEGKSRPVVMTASNMYPGAFILHDVLEGWFKEEGRDKLRMRAAKAYAANQKIGTRSASGVFAELR